MEIGPRHLLIDAGYRERRWAADYDEGDGTLTKSQNFTLGCLAVLVVATLLFFVFVVLALGTSGNVLPDNLFGGQNPSLVTLLEASLRWTLPTSTPQPRPTSTPTRTPTRTPTPTATATPTFTPTATRTPTIPPTPTFTRVIEPPTATPVPVEPVAKLGPTPSPELVEQAYASSASGGPVIAGASYAAAEVLTVQLVNEERQKAGLAALEKQPVLDQIAQQRSQDMAERGYFSHEDPDGGQLPLERLLLTNGFDYLQAGENIAYFLGPTEVELLPRLSLAKWMESAAHRENLMDGAYNQTGFGIASTQTAEGTMWYLTEVFVER